MLTSPEMLNRRKRRRAVSGILAAVLLFGMMFTAGMGYFAWTSKNIILQEQANGKAQNAALQASQERLNITLTPCMKAVSSCKYPGSLVIEVANTGGAASTVVSVFATYKGANAFKSPYQYLTGSSGIGLNLSLPISIPVGSTTSAMQGCGGSGSCNIDLILPWSSFTNSSRFSNTNPLLVSVLTLTGNTFTSPYPPFPLSKSVTIENLYQTTVTSEQETITSVTNTQVTYSQFQIGCLNCVYEGGAGGSALLLQLQASPSPASSGDIINVTAHVSNFASDQATGVGVTLRQLNTGTASVSPTTESCTVSGGSQTTTIPGDTGGLAPSTTFSCLFTAAAGATGGIVSFEGSAQGTIDTKTVATTATSNPIQIGIVATLGPWAIKYFYFDYTSTKATSLTPVSTLAADGSSPDKYVAMYAIVTNTYSKSLTILDNSYLQLVSPSTDINFFMTQSGYATGNTTAGTISTVLHDSNLGATSGSLVGLYLQYTSGPAAGQSQVITSNTATTITTAAFSPAPSSSGNSFVVTPIRYSGSSASFTPYGCFDQEQSSPLDTVARQSCITLAPGQSVTLAFAATNFIIASGTTTSGSTSTSLHDSNLGATSGSLVGLDLEYTSGPAAGQFRQITANTGTTITTSAFSPAPDSSGDTYFVTSLQGGSASGTTTSGSSNTVLTDSSLGATAGSLVGQYLFYTSGPAAGQFRQITANTGTTITTSAFSPAPDSSGDTYFVTASNSAWEWSGSVPGFSSASGETVQILLDYCFVGSNGYEIHAIDLPFQGVYIS